MKDRKAAEIVDGMYDKDGFSQWLGIERIESTAGTSTLVMTVRPEMVNGFGVAHGGITFSLADSAFAFASNSRGRKAMSIECSINHLKAVRVGDVLTAVASEESVSNKLGVYIVRVYNQEKDLVALFRGMVYRMSEEWQAQ